MYGWTRGQGKGLGGEDKVMGRRMDDDDDDVRCGDTLTVLWGNLVPSRVDR